MGGYFSKVQKTDNTSINNNTSNDSETTPILTASNVTDYSAELPNTTTSILLSDIAKAHVNEHQVDAIDGKKLASLLFYGEQINTILELLKKPLSTTDEKLENDEAVVQKLLALYKEKDTFDFSSINADVAPIINQLYDLLICGTPYIKESVGQNYPRDVKLFCASLKFFSGIALEEDEKKLVENYFLDKKNIKTIFSVKIRNAEQSKYLHQASSGKLLHIADLSASEVARYQSIIDDLAEALLQFISSAIGMTAAILFYPIVADKLLPFFEDLGFSQEASESIVMILKIASTGTNCLWNSSLVNIAGKLTREYGIKPLLKMIFKQELNRKNVFDFAYFISVGFGAFCYSLGMNSLTVKEDYDEVWQFYFSMTVNALIMMPAASGTYEFCYKRVLNHMRKEALIGKLLESNKIQNHQLAACIRHLQYMFDTMKNSTPVRLQIKIDKNSFNPYQRISFDIFDKKPLVKAVTEFRNHDFKDNFLYMNGQVAFEAQLRMALDISNIDASPADSLFNTNFFRYILWTLCGLAMTGYGLNGVLLSDDEVSSSSSLEEGEEYSDNQLIFLRIAGSIGWIGLLMNELRFTWNIMDDIRGPSLVKFMGGSANNIFNVVNAMLFVFCLFSGAGTAGSIYEALTDLDSPDWLITISVFFCIIVGGCSNAFAIKTFIDDTSTTAIGIGSYANDANTVLDQRVTYDRFSKFVNIVMAEKLLNTLMREAQEEIKSIPGIKEEDKKIITRSYHALVIDKILGVCKKSNHYKKNDAPNDQSNVSDTARPILRAILQNFDTKIQPFFDKFNVDPEAKLLALQTDASYAKALVPKMGGFI